MKTHSVELLRLWQSQKEKKNSQIVLPAREQIYEKLKLYEKGRPSAYLTKPIVLSLISSSAVIFRPFGN